MKKIVATCVVALSATAALPPSPAQAALPVKPDAVIFQGSGCKVTQHRKRRENQTVQFHRLISNADFANSFPLMRELRTHLTPETYLELLEEMTADRYELWALSNDGDMKALAGIACRTNLYYGRYLWVFDLVTKGSERSAGYGAALLNHVEELARQRGCDVVALSSGLERVDAHRFYEAKMGYDKPSFVFKKELRDEPS